MGATPIEWTDFSVNPIRARLGDHVGHFCEKVSPGCKNCYSSRFQPRRGLPQFQEQRDDDRIVPFLDAAKLEEVLRRGKPTKFFWCDMTDMFGSWVPDEWIAACFGVMAATPHHTHQVLTKRAERMETWFSWVASKAAEHHSTEVGACATYASQQLGRSYTTFMPHLLAEWPTWPLRNVWLGISVEDQQRADERIPHLLATPAAVRFVSAEPLLGPIKIPQLLTEHGRRHIGARPGIGWVIIGSESGPRARPMAVEWAESLRDQCVRAGVSFFTKQIATAEGRLQGDRKGSDPQWWPGGPWPRQFPGVRP